MSADDGSGLSQWAQLEIHTPDIDWRDVPQVVEESWRALVEALRPHSEVDISGPEAEAWFHLRRRLRTEGEEADRRVSRIEIMRLLVKDENRALRDLLESKAHELPSVASVTWKHLKFDRPDAGMFLSFVQKLSVLRVVRGIVVGRYLAGISSNYADCPFCQEAYSIMRQPGKPWSKELADWFEVMDRPGVSRELTHEYAHWFGHILSGWPPVFTHSV